MPSLYYAPEGGHDVSYQTSSKKIAFTYAEFIDDPSGSAYYPTAVMDVTWFTIPKIKNMIS